MLLQNNPEGYHADSKVNEGVLGPELWNAAQVRAVFICFHQLPLVCMLVFPVLASPLHS